MQRCQRLESMSVQEHSDVLKRLVQCWFDEARVQVQQTDSAMVGLLKAVSI